jgi:hypothetical protein
MVACLGCGRTGDDPAPPADAAPSTTTQASTTSPTTQVDPLNQTSTCAGLVPFYEELVRRIVAAEGSRDPAVFGTAVADLVLLRGAIRVIGWLDDALTDEQIASLQAEIGSWESVRGVVHFTKEQALAEFRTLFAERPELIAVVEQDPSVLPASLRVAVDESAVDEVHGRLAVLPGLTQVTSAREEIEDLMARTVWIAVGYSGRANDLQDLDRRAADLGCTLAGVAADADLAGIDPGGIIGEWILAAAGEGLPVRPPAP